MQVVTVDTDPLAWESLPKCQAPIHALLRAGGQSRRAIMQNLELEVSSGEGGRYRVAARSDAAGDSQGPLTQLPLDEQMLARRLQAVEFALVSSTATVRRLAPVDEQPVQEFGRQLFEFLFPAEVREHLNAVRRQAAQESTSVQVRLRIGSPELAALPWEFLYDPGRDDYLCLSTSLVRYLEVLEPRLPLAVTPPLRVLGMVARPGELDPLNVDHEKRRLREALAGLERAGRVELTWVAGQTWWDLQNALDQGLWHIFHFIGHGDFDQQSGEGILALTGEDGGVHRLAASDLGLLLGEHHSLRLVVLNSCQSARSSTSDVFSSTAAVLMRRGIPAVVAMQYDISDEAAIAFARGLYTAVAARHPVGQAVTRARRAIKLTRRNTLEWATPVLYLRSPRGDLFDLAAAGPSAEVAEPPVLEPQAPHRPGDDLAQQPIQAPPPDSALPRDPAARPPRVSQARTGSELARLKNDGVVEAVAFSPDGTRLATASRDGTARLWEVATGREQARLEHDGWVTRVAFSPDGTRLATSNDRTARLWEVATGREQARLQHDGVVEAVAFSPDGTRLATASRDGTARLWEVATGRELGRMKHVTSVRAVAFSPDGTRLATSNDRMARLWEVATGREQARLEHNDGVSAVAFSPDGTRLATVSPSRTARLWEVATGQEQARLQHYAGAVEAVAFSPDGTRLATASRDGTARLWEVATGQELARLEHDDRVSAVAFSPDGTRLATASRDGTARLWEVATGQELARMQHDDRVSAVAFSPDGTRLATASNDRTARLWAA